MAGVTLFRTGFLCRRGDRSTDIDFARSLNLIRSVARACPTLWPEPVRPCVISTLRLVWLENFPAFQERCLRWHALFDPCPISPEGFRRPISSFRGEPSGESCRVQRSEEGG